MPSSRATNQALGAETKQGEQLGEVHESFSLAFFRSGQSKALVLLVEQRAEPFGNAFGQPELGQVARHLDFEMDRLRHILFQFLLRTLTQIARCIQAEQFKARSVNYEHHQ